MSRIIHRWIVAVLISLLAMPAAPVLARHGQGHECCGGTTAAAAQAHDCAMGVTVSEAAPACIDGGSNQDPTQPNLCLHCIAAAVSTGVAFWPQTVNIPHEASAYVAVAHVSPFVPVAPVHRLERPPKTASL